MAAVPSRVCVTGASGFIASHVVAQLLERGHSVHGTVRDATNPEKTKHLLALPGSERLKLFSAELTGDTANWDKAFEGCETIMHTATPIFFNTSDPEKDIFEPGMQGMREVINAVQRMQDVKTFILTSSMAAVAPQPEPPIKTEEHWSDSSKQKGRSWYGACKTEQEKLFWEFDEKVFKEKGVRCVAINPTSVGGPMLQPTVNATCSFWINAMKNGKEGKAANDSMSIVDVRDVAKMHVAAMERSDVTGRYMACAGDPVEGQPETVRQAMHWNDIFLLLNDVYPECPPVEKCEGEPVATTKWDMKKMADLVPLAEQFTPKQIFEELCKEGKRFGILNAKL